MFLLINEVSWITQFSLMSEFVLTYQAVFICYLLSLFNLFAISKQHIISSPFIAVPCIERGSHVLKMFSRYILHLRFNQNGPRPLIGNIVLILLILFTAQQLTSCLEYGSIYISDLSEDLIAISILTVWSCLFY